MPRRSIQRELSRSILLTSLVLLLIAGLTSASLAFYEAREMQDNLLREIAHLLGRDRLRNILPLARGGNEEHTIIIQMLGRQPAETVPRIPEHIPDGLQTIKLSGEEWRVLVTTRPGSDQRIAVAQQTELRDNIALASSFYAVLPIVLLVMLMLLLIHFIIRNRLRPLKNLKDQLDRQEVTKLKVLPEKDLPEEISPFVKSINTLLARTQQSIQKQHRFIADAAHELRTPVAALTLLAENVERASSKSERLERLGKLHQGLDRLNTLIVQLLDLARLQNNIPNMPSAVSLNTIVQEVIADLHPLADAMKVDLGVVRQESIVLMDQGGRLGQLVRNAIDNALRYSPAGSKVDVSLFAEDEYAVFYVEDSGAGIPENERELVLEPFYRTDGMSQAGNGLGLAICREIAQLLGGIISLSNRPGGGLRFTYRQHLARTDITIS